MKKELTWYAYVSDDMIDIEVRLLASSIDEADDKIKQFKNLKGFFCAFSYSANDHRPTKRPRAQLDAALLQQRTGNRTNQ